MVVSCDNELQKLQKMKKEQELSSKFLTMSVMHLKDLGIPVFCVDIDYI